MKRSIISRVTRIIVWIIWSAIVIVLLITCGEKMDDFFK